MVFRKFRPSKQWGVYDTRLFKAMLDARNKRRMPSYKVSPNLLELGVEIHDPNDINFPTPKPIPRVDFEHPAFKVPSIKDHPLYKEQRCLLFDGSEPFTDGIDQACALTKAIKRMQFPEDILSKAIMPKNAEQLLNDCIMHGERYDPTLERLPKLHDPILFWIVGKAVLGTPVLKRCNIILDNIFRALHLNAVQRGRLDYLRCDYDEPTSVILKGDMFKQEPFVIRGQPHMVLQSPQPLKLWLPKEEIDSLNDEKIPDITPIQPFIDLTKDNVYNDDVLLPRRNLPLHVDTLLWSREQDQKYPWTMEQNAANAIMYCFGAALLEACRKDVSLIDKAVDLDNPVLARAIQLVNGRIDFVVFQLNTLDFSSQNPRKNIVWIEHGQRLYKPGKHVENYDKVVDMNVDTFVKFLRLLLTR